jgi:hypothetical protein
MAYSFNFKINGVAACDEESVNLRVIDATRLFYLGFREQRYEPSKLFTILHDFIFLGP